MPNDFDDAAMSEAALADWNRPEEDAAWAHLQDATKPALTPMLQKVIEAAKALPEEDQDALAAEILEWIEEERRWSESFARTHDALAELAREALAEHHSGETLEGETEAAEWTERLLADAADKGDRPWPAADG